MGYLSRFEERGNCLRLDDLMQIARALDIPVETLIKDTKY